MFLTAKVKLTPRLEGNRAQAESLKRTMERANAACNYISEIAWDEQLFNKFALQKRVYYDVKTEFNLCAQIAILCSVKVADAYKLDKESKRTFKPLGSTAFDNRVLSWNLEQNTVSIWTVDGRIKHLTFVAHDRAKELLSGSRKESDLCFIDGEFYLFTSCEVDEPTPADVDDILGIDLGIKNIAVDSDGQVHSAKAVNNVRFRHRKLRTKLQKKQTHAARRKLRKLAGKERRFATWVNHNVSKEIVEKAKDTGRGIAIEELGGIRDRVTVRKSQRATLHSWSFTQLRLFIEYKAQRQGVKVFPVDPRNTSRTCPDCGCIDKANRPTQSKFSCVSCGYSGLADHIAATNIRSRTLVNVPYIPTALAGRDKANVL